MRLFSISTAMLLASATVCAAFSGSLMPEFEMSQCVGEAELIVRGFLDENGNIQAQEVLKGEPSTKVIAVADGAKIYQYLFASINTNATAAQSAKTIEVVAFLNDKTTGVWRLVMGYTSIVGLEDTNVYIFEMMGPRFDAASFDKPIARRDEHFNRESFLFAVKDEVRVSDQLDEMAALPRLSERAQQLVSFLLKNGGSYHRWRVASSFRPVNPDESKEILKEIGDTHDIAAKCLLVDLAGDIPLSPDAFDSIASFIDAQNPRQLRRVAMWAIARINPPEATKRILPFINIGEPELDEALMSLEAPATGVSPDLNVVDALLSLSKQMRTQDARGVQPISDAAQQALRQQFTHYAHAKLITFYFDWLLNSKLSNPDNVTSDLQAMLGVQWSGDQLKIWWEQQRQIIEPDYNLQMEGDQRKWFDAYQNADDVSKKFLVRLWMFTPATNQLALVKAATEEKTAGAAKTTITQLWDNNHLSNEAKQAMFENFLKVDFIDEAKTYSSRFRNQHDLATVLTFNYPFNTCINYRTPITIDGKLIGTTTSQGSVCLEPKLKEYRLGNIGGYVPGKAATGTLEIFQLDHYPEGKELWHAQWQLGPVPLGE